MIEVGKAPPFEMPKGRAIEDCPLCRPDASLVLRLEMGCVVQKHHTDQSRLLVVPLEHCAELTEMQTSVGNLLIVARAVARELGLKNYRLKLNQGRFQHVKHLHLHLIADHALTNPLQQPGRVPELGPAGPGLAEVPPAG